MNKAELQSTNVAANATNSVFEADMVGVNLIRLFERPRSVCAMLRSFSAADKILADWCLEFGGIFDCEFEITYGDGYTVSGNYRFAPKGSAKPALTRHLRAAALAACRGVSCLPVRGLALSDFAFLDRYETNDSFLQERVRKDRPPPAVRAVASGKADSV